MSYDRLTKVANSVIRYFPQAVASDEALILMVAGADLRRVGFTLYPLVSNSASACTFTITDAPACAPRLHLWRGLVPRNGGASVMALLLSGHSTLVESLRSIASY